MPEEAAGPRIPILVTVFSGVLFLVALFMHGRVEIIDRPLFYVGPFPITTFGIVTTVASAIFVTTIRNLMLVVDHWTNMNMATMALKIICLVLGAYLLIQIILYAVGLSTDIVSPGARLLAGGVRPGGSP